MTSVVSSSSSPHHKKVSKWRSLAKAISWRVVGTLDTLLLSFLILTFLRPFFGFESDASHVENAQIATGIAITEVLTKTFLYYFHERIWTHVSWGMTNPSSHRVCADSWWRTTVKTTTWRVTASLDTFLLAYFFTGEVTTALSIGGLEVITKLVLYFFHERAWLHIKFGVS